MGNGYLEEGLPGALNNRTRSGYPSRVPRVVPPSEVPLYNP